MGKPLNDPADLFASDDHAARNPETYGKRERPALLSAVSGGAVNALKNDATRARQRTYRRKRKVQQTDLFSRGTRR